MTKTTTATKKGPAIYYDLPSGIVVDQARFNTLKASEAAAATMEIVGIGKPFIFVENANTFFSKKNILETLTGDTTHLPLMLEHAEITISEASMSVLQQFSALRADIEQALKGKVPDYPFMAVPEGWSVEKNLLITKSYVTRHGVGGGYKVTLKGMERVWKKASVAWLKDVGAPTSKGTLLARIPNASLAGYTRDARIYKEVIEIGCQTVQRYELEQLARHLGWDMPE